MSGAAASPSVPRTARCRARTPPSLRRRAADRPGRSSSGARLWSALQIQLAHDCTRKALDRPPDVNICRLCCFRALLIFSDIALRRLIRVTKDHVLSSAARHRLAANAEPIFSDLAGDRDRRGRHLPTARACCYRPSRVDWADIIFVMEKTHRTKLSRKFRPSLKGKGSSARHSRRLRIHGSGLGADAGSRAGRFLLDLACLFACARLRMEYRRSHVAVAGALAATGRRVAELTDHRSRNAPPAASEP